MTRNVPVLFQKIEFYWFQKTVIFFGDGRETPHRETKIYIERFSRDAVSDLTVVRQLPTCEIVRDGARLAGLSLTVSQFQEVFLCLSTVSQNENLLKTNK
eukprot:TRINITY_DN22860_c1_g1_i1.p1 TRINITY_DN22860_c1_g1~~TRINITY_DN22860_c1_g1_i1.p1  ORF type:complete len:100 (-),score=8.00 TRINITY_DN22860_c1_g1_i1:13-312(-)